MKLEFGRRGYASLKLGRSLGTASATKDSLEVTKIVLKSHHRDFHIHGG